MRPTHDYTSILHTLPNHDRFPSAGGGNGTSVAVMSMPNLLAVVGCETHEGVYNDAPSCSHYERVWCG